MKRVLYTSLVLFTLPTFAARSSEQVLRRAQVVSIITEAATSVGVPVELMLAVAWVESSYRTNLPTVRDGSTPSYGIFQIKLETAQWVDRVYKHRHVATAALLKGNVHANAYYACKYMRLLIRRYNGDVRMAVDAYNKGHVVSTKSHYVAKVNRAMRDIQ